MERARTERIRADALDKGTAPGRKSWAGWRQYLPTDLSAFLPYLPAALSALRLPYQRPAGRIASSTCQAAAFYFRALLPISCNRCIHSGFFFACVRKVSLRNSGRCKSMHHSMARQMFSMLNTLCDHPSRHATVNRLHHSRTWGRRAWLTGNSTSHNQTRQVTPQAQSNGSPPRLVGPGACAV